ncbi:MAG TPA: hypothetical protein VHC42_08795 [Rhizomicrobium sp.]|nr:hypothetical protein [Rhizomicrobium sp.]
MSFREKTAWISLFANLLVYGVYFAMFVSALQRGPIDKSQFFELFVGCFAAVVVAMIVLTVIAAIFSPRDASAPLDERERLIALKAMQFGYFILAASVVMAVGAAYFGLDGFLLANALFFALVLAEVAHYGAQIYYHRRGA